VWQSTARRETSAREYLLCAVITVVDVHTRISDLYSVPHNQIAQQLRLAIEAIKERQESENFPALLAIDGGVRALPIVSLTSAASRSIRTRRIGARYAPDRLEREFRSRESPSLCGDLDPARECRRGPYSLGPGNDVARTVAVLRQAKSYAIP
jgi:hypothetical protein